MWDGECPHTPCRTHIFFAHFPCVTCRQRVHAWLKVFAVRVSYLSISPSPFSCFIRRLCCFRGHFDTTFPSAPSSSSFTQAHPRAPGSLATWPITHHRDKTTSVDGDTTPTKNLSLLEKHTRETSVSHVSCDDFALQRGGQESMQSGNRWKTERKRGKRKFCDQCCRIDVKEKSTEQY